MKTAWRPSLLTGSLCTLAALLAGCSAGSGKGYGKAGGQSSYEPEAVITPIGHVRDSEGALHVRSGAEVVLSAKDSNGVDSAVLGVTWTAANAAAADVKMLERGATAMSFRAPLPPDNNQLELRFKLTVRTADGETSDSQIRVLVDRVPDANDFLLTDLSTSVESVNLAVIATGYQTTTLAQDVPFQLTVQKQVRYKRAIQTGPNPSLAPTAADPVYCQSTDPTLLCVKIGEAVPLSGTWLRDAGFDGLLSNTGATQTDKVLESFRNPRFRLPLPSLNVDEVNFAVLSAGISNNGTGVAPQDPRRNNLLYTADIEAAEAEYLIKLAPESTVAAALNTRTTLLVFVADSTASPYPLRLERFNVTPGIGDTAVVTITRGAALASARSSGVVESAGTAAAYYAAIDPAGQRDTLEKWLKDNCFQPQLAGRPGYYGADIHSTYLNDRDLGFGREMYFKTTCTDAQQGATSASIKTVNGERASIVFNYPSLEAAIKRTNSFLAVAMEYRADAGGGAKYTRFYTFAPDPRTRTWTRVPSANFDGRGERYTPGNCTVCHGGKPRASYAVAPAGGDVGATFIPWDANALLFADTDSSILDERTKTGFTRAEQLPNIQALNIQGVVPIINSRIQDAPAATQPRWEAMLSLIQGWYPIGLAADYARVPDTWKNGTSSGSPTLSSEKLYGEVFAENCRMCHLQRITKPDTAPGATGLVEDVAPQFSSFADSYVSGINAGKLRQRVFQQHLMPASRLTSDRFWVRQPDATKPAAEVLAEHFGLALSAATPAVTAVADGPSEVETGTAQVEVRLSGLGSLLATRYRWTLEKPDNSSAVLVGDKTAEPGFRADVSGTYRARLTVTDSSGREDDLDTPLRIVANGKPHAKNFTISPRSGDPVSVAFSFYGVTLGDGNNTLTVTNNLPNTSLGYPGFCTSTGLNSGGNCRIVFTATSSGTIDYVFTDVDGDLSSGTITVNVALPDQWSIATRNISAGTCLPGSGTNTCSTPLDIYPIALAKSALNLTGLTDQQFTNTYAVTVTATPTSQSGRTGLKGVVVVDLSAATAISYTPPPLFVSAQPGGSVVDTFQFNIKVQNLSTSAISQSANGIVNMTVPARTRWSTQNPGQAGEIKGVYAFLQEKCNACHTAAPSSTENRGWGYLGDATNGDNTYASLLAQPNAGYTSGCPLGETTGAPACVSFNAPLGSLLLRKPLGEYFHYYGPPAPAPTAPPAGCDRTRLDADCGYAVLTTTEINQRLRDWILDGAYRN